MILVRAIVVLSLALCVVAWPDATASAACSGRVSTRPSKEKAMGEAQSRERSPAQQAATAHNRGVAQVRKAQRYANDAAAATDAGKRVRADAKSRSAYEVAQSAFESAVALDPSLHEAWNMLGFSRRHLGNHAAALEAYERALALKPGYPEAIEYRGEAYLGLDRLDDARSAYLELFANARTLADQLLAAMQAWLEAHQAEPGAIDPQALDAFAKWVEERSAIARQTASLDPGGPATGWR